MRRSLAALSLFISLLCPLALPIADPQTTPAQQDTKTQTVYITRTGKKYHRAGCRYSRAQCHSDRVERCQGERIHAVQGLPADGVNHRRYVR